MIFRIGRKAGRQDQIANFLNYEIGGRRFARRGKSTEEVRGGELRKVGVGGFEINGIFWGGKPGKVGGLR
jgi:hypothetical protein